MDSTGKPIVGGKESVAGRGSQEKLRRSSIEPGRGEAIVSTASLHAIRPDGGIGDNLYVSDQGSPGKRLPATSTPLHLPGVRGSLFSKGLSSMANSASSLTSLPPMADGEFVLEGRGRVEPHPRAPASAGFGGSSRPTAARGMRTPASALRNASGPREFSRDSADLLRRRLSFKPNPLTREVSEEIDGLSDPKAIVSRMEHLEKMRVESRKSMQDWLYERDGAHTAFAAAFIALRDRLNDISPGFTLSDSVAVTAELLDSKDQNHLLENELVDLKEQLSIAEESLAVLMEGSEEGLPDNSDDAMEESPLVGRRALELQGEAEAALSRASSAEKDRRTIAEDADAEHEKRERDLSDLKASNEKLRSEIAKNKRLLVEKAEEVKALTARLGIQSGQIEDLTRGMAAFRRAEKEKDGEIAELRGLNDKIFAQSEEANRAIALLKQQLKGQEAASAEEIGRLNAHSQGQSAVIVDLDKSHRRAIEELRAKIAEKDLEIEAANQRASQSQRDMADGEVGGLDLGSEMAAQESEESEVVELRKRVAELEEAALAGERMRTRARSDVGPTTKPEVHPHEASLLKEQLTKAQEELKAARDALAAAEAGYHEKYVLPLEAAKLEAKTALEDKLAIQAEMSELIARHAAEMEVMRDKLAAIEKEQKEWHLKQQNLAIALDNLVKKIVAFEGVAAIKAVDQHMARISDPQAKLEKLGERVDALQEKFLGLLKTNEALQVKADRRKERLGEAKSAAEGAQAAALEQHNKDQLSLALVEAELQQLKASAGAASSDKDQQIVALTTETVALRAKVKLQAEQIELQTVNITGLTKELQKAQERIAALEKDGASYKEQIARLNATASQSAAEIDALRRNVAEGAEALDAQRKLVGERVGVISSQEREIAKLKATNDSLASERDGLAAQLDHLRQQITEKDRGIEGQRQRILELDAAAAAAALKEGGLRDDIAAKEGEIATLRRDNASSADEQSAALAAARTQASELDHKLREAILARAQAEESLTRVNAQHAADRAVWELAKAALQKRADEALEELEAERVARRDAEARSEASLATIESQQREIEGIKNRQDRAGAASQRALEELGALKDELVVIARGNGIVVDDDLEPDARDKAIETQQAMIAKLQGLLDRRGEAAPSIVAPAAAAPAAVKVHQPADKRKSFVRRSLSNLASKLRRGKKKSDSDSTHATEDREDDAASTLSGGRSIAGPADLAQEIADLQAEIEGLGDRRKSRRPGVATDDRTDEILRLLREKLAALAEETRKKDALQARLDEALHRADAAESYNRQLAAELGERPEAYYVARLQDENSRLAAEGLAARDGADMLREKLGGLERLLLEQDAKLGVQESELRRLRNERDSKRQSVLASVDSDEESALGDLERRLREQESQFLAALSEKDMERDRLRSEVAVLGDRLEEAQRKVADFAALQAELVAEKARSRELQRRIEDGAASAAAGAANDDPAERERREKAESELLELRKGLLALAERGRWLGNSGPVAESIRTLSDGIGALVHDDVVVGPPSAAADKKTPKKRWFGGGKVTPEPEARPRFDASIDNAALIRRLQEELAKLKALLSPAPAIIVDDASAHLDDDIRGFSAEGDRRMLDDLTRALAAVAGARRLQEELDASRTRIAALEAALGGAQGPRRDGEAPVTVSTRSIAVASEAPMSIAPLVIYQDFGARIGKLYGTMTSLIEGSGTRKRYANREFINAAGTHSDLQSLDFPDSMLFVSGDNAGLEIGIRIYGPEDSKRVQIMQYDSGARTWKPGVDDNEEYALLEQAEKIAAAKVDLMAQDLARLGALQDENARLKEQLARLQEEKEHMATPAFANRAPGHWDVAGDPYLSSPPLQRRMAGGPSMVGGPEFASLSPFPSASGGRRAPEERVDHSPAPFPGIIDTVFNDDEVHGSAAPLPRRPVPPIGGGVPNPRSSRLAAPPPSARRPVERPRAEDLAPFSETQRNTLDRALRATAKIIFAKDKKALRQGTAEEMATSDKAEVAKVLIRAWTKIQDGVQDGKYREGNAEDLLTGEIRLTGINVSDPFSLFTLKGKADDSRIKILETRIPELKDAMQQIRQFMTTYDFANKRGNGSAEIHGLINKTVWPAIEKYNKNILGPTELKALMTFGFCLQNKDDEVKKHPEPLLFKSLDDRDKDLKGENREAVAKILGDAQGEVAKWGSAGVIQHLTDAKAMGRPPSPTTAKRASALVEAASERASTLMSEEATKKARAGAGGRGGDGSHGSEA